VGPGETTGGRWPERKAKPAEEAVSLLLTSLERESNLGGRKRKKPRGHTVSEIPTP